MNKKIIIIYERLYRYFGPQHWWPGDSPFEVIVGAILTQNTNWQNTAKAIKNLKDANALAPRKLHNMPKKNLAALIRPSGYYNIKAKRLKNFLEFLFRKYSGSLARMFGEKPDELREEILSVKGIGPETADSILLYAAGFPEFVIDAYTKRILYRHKLAKEDADYHEVKQIFVRNLPRKTKLFNEYHALLVRLGKEFCLKNNPRCAVCPLK